MVERSREEPVALVPLWRGILFGNPSAVRVLGILVSLDLVFLVVHGVKYAFKEEFIDLFGYWIYRNLTITNDWAIPEITNYLKFAGIVYLLGAVFVRVRQPVYLAWAFVYALALIDDSLQVHEGLGEHLSGLLAGATVLGVELDALEGSTGFRAQDLGELLVYGIYGGIFVGVLGIGFAASQGIHRQVGAGFALLLAALAFFVAAVDMLDRLVIALSSGLAKVLATAEDSGEMLVVSATLAFALGVWQRYAPHGGASL
jgi:hypothetical protein